MTDTPEIDNSDALSSAQQIRLDALGYLIQLEGAPIIKSLADFKEMCADTAVWIETGAWPEVAKPAAKLKKIDGGRDAPKAPGGQ